MELDHIGGTYGGNNRPTPFICLVLKMLQIQPEKEIVVEFIKNEEYKCVHDFSFGIAGRIMKDKYAIPSFFLCRYLIPRTVGRYVRALGAFYLRLIGKAIDVYNYLEPVCTFSTRDYRFPVRQCMHGNTLMCQFVELLHGIASSVLIRPSLIVYLGFALAAAQRLSQAQNHHGQQACIPHGEGHQAPRKVSTSP
jgi:pre-mRNA-splicing factor 38A